MLFDQNATSSRASSNRIVGIVDGFFLSAVQQFRHWRHFCSMIDLRFRPNTHKSRHYEWVGYSNEQWQAACKCSTSLMRLMIETVISVFRSFSVFHFLSISVWLTSFACAHIATLDICWYWNLVHTLLLFSICFIILDSIWKFWLPKLWILSLISLSSIFILWCSVWLFRRFVVCSHRWQNVWILYRFRTATAVALVVDACIWLHSAHIINTFSRNQVNIMCKSSSAIEFAATECGIERNVSGREWECQEINGKSQNLCTYARHSNTYYTL